MAPGHGRAGGAYLRAQSLPDTHEKIFVLIHLAKSYERLGAIAPAFHRASLLNAHHALHTAIGLSRVLGDGRSLSLGLGNWAGLYQSEHRYEEALFITRQALNAAQSANAPDAEYRWHWRAGQILWAQGHSRQALVA